MKFDAIDRIVEECKSCGGQKECALRKRPDLYNRCNYIAIYSIKIKDKLIEYDIKCGLREQKH